MNIFTRFKYKIDSFVGTCNSKYLPHILYDMLDIDLLEMQFQFTGCQPVGIQNVVNQIQHKMTGRYNVVQIFLYHIRNFISEKLRKLCRPNNSIQRSSEIMTHA